jgi:hypothetical protein
LINSRSIAIHFKGGALQARVVTESGMHWRRQIPGWMSSGLPTN